MRRSISIRASLLRDLALLVLILGIGIFGATFVGARRAVRSLSESLVGQTLATVEARLDAFFAEPRQQLAVARGQAVVGGFDLDAGAEAALGDGETRFLARRDHRNRLLVPIIESSPQISSVMLADAGGREHMLLRADGGWRNRCSAAGEVRWLEWSDGTTPVERRETLDYDPRGRPWYRGAVAARAAGETGGETVAVHWTEPYTFFTTKEPRITVSAAYDRGDGRERVIGFDVLLRDLSDFTRELGVGERGITAVLTADRRLVGLPGLPAFDDPAARAGAYLKQPLDLGLTLIDDAVAAFGTRPAAATTTYRFVSGGEVWWGCAEPYALSPERSLRVAILVPEADLLGNLLMLRVIILLIVGIVLGVGVFRAVVVARRFSAPVEALVEQSGRITQGDLEPAAPIVSPIAEIQQLVRAQEHMREGILARLKLEKVERDLDLAREIQRGLLPDAPPEVDGFEIAGWNQAADETGGDFYDWLVLPDGRLVITLADVTGHGIGPALIVAVYRAYMRASTTFGTPHLATALSHVNDLLYADIPADRFITAVVAVIEPETGRMLMVSAGHAPLLFYEAAAGTVHSWIADDVPLGIVDGLEFETPREVAFATGDMLVLVTDGFFEWANASGEQFGLARLETFVREHQHLPGADLIQALHRAVLAHAGGTEQGDDLTAVVIRRTGRSA